MNDEAISDHSLLQRFRRGQDGGATLLFLRYAKRVRALASAQVSPGLASRLAPDDIVQSVFCSFFRRVAQGQYDVPRGEEIWKLLLVIALHKICDAGNYHRAARRDFRQTQGGEAYERAIQSIRGQDEAAMAVLRMVIDEVLDGLPASHRPIIELRIEGHEVAEISGRLRRSKRTVERVLQEFRRKLDSQIREAH
ncbi:RNA polymerase sigma factor SigX [Aquisphaera giovannonii]|uniref:RNA polymerase sigma factor SigX n=1 Tax=Aquisphaera giovannonii TaxID=406548 RepID=A0A5B9VWF7_9BACT|nr:sigma-70 family RNA polymerase sigma factor [Aquisphaera giovannonii]QEH32713.1 RNA polymerase sigma factor SigX [Aquisphaera giovannonii]